MKAKKNTAPRRSADVIPLPRRGYTDSDIAAGVKAGNPAATDALVERFGPSINRRVWRLLGPDREREDIIQQIFVQILHALPALKKTGALSDWINKVTINVVRKELRRRKYRRIVGFSTEQVEATVDISDADDRLFVSRCFQILQGMGAEERIMFVMRFVEGCELKEIAAATGCSLATVKRKLSRARDIFIKKARRDSVVGPLVDRLGYE